MHSSHIGAIGRHHELLCMYFCIWNLSRDLRYECTKTLLRRVHGAIIHLNLELCAVLPLATLLSLEQYQNITNCQLFGCKYLLSRKWIWNNCKAWYQKLLSANGHMFTVGLCKVGTQNDSRGNSRASAKQLSHNKSCRFQLEYIDMQPNHILSVANIGENRYTWTELPHMERAFHCRQISGTGRNRDGTNQSCGDGNSIRLAANTKKHTEMIKYSRNT